MGEQEIAGQGKAHESEELRMPTRRDLEEAGRPDLVAMVARAGGFPVVANTLGLRSRRHPVGYWDNLENLDQVCLGLFLPHRPSSLPTFHPSPVFL